MGLRSFDELRTFVQVVESGSVTEAARRLQVPQATLSRRLAALEERLGTKLLYRSTRSMSLSEAGQTLLSSARRILAEADCVEVALTEERKGLSGAVKISVPTLLAQELMVALEPLLEAHADLRATVVVRDTFVSPVADSVDVCIWGGPLQDSSLVARKLLDVHLVLAASKKYLRAHGTPRSIDDLSEHVFVLRGPGQPFATLIDEDGKRHPLHVKGRIEVRDGRAMLDALSLGYGIGIASIRALNRRPELRRVLPDHALQTLALSAIFPAAMQRSARLNAVLDHLEASLGPVMASLNES